MNRFYWVLILIFVFSASTNAQNEYKKLNYLQTGYVYLYYESIDKEVENDKISDFEESETYKEIGKYLLTQIGIKLPFYCATEINPQEYIDTISVAEGQVINDDNKFYRGKNISYMTTTKTGMQVNKAYIKYLLNDSLYYDNKNKDVCLHNGCLKGDFLVSFEVNAEKKLQNIQIIKTPIESKNDYVIDSLQGIQSILPGEFSSGLNHRFYVSFKYY